MDIKIAYSDPINSADAIPSTYSSIRDAFNHLTKRTLPTKIFTQSNIELLNLFKNTDKENLRLFSRKQLASIIDYEKKHRVPLIKTMKTFIDTKFNAKETATSLYIHYNTLRYRLNVLKKLGHDLTDTKKPHFDLYFALYLHDIFSE